MAKTKEERLATAREWKKRNKERHAELARAYRLRNKEKTLAQNRLNYALRKGRIVKGNCEKCGSAENVHAHHHDYSKPLDVNWLCFLCHKASHQVDDEHKEIKFKDARRSNQRGSDIGTSKISAEDVKRIRRAYYLGITQDQLAKAFGLHQTQVSRIILRQAWAHID